MTHYSPTRTHCPGRVLSFCWSKNRRMNAPRSPPPTMHARHFKELWRAHFSLSGKSRGSVVFSLTAEWIVHWTVRGTSWTSAAVLTLRQWGAVRLSPRRSREQPSDTVGGGDPSCHRLVFPDSPRDIGFPSHAGVIKYSSAEMSF